MAASELSSQVSAAAADGGEGDLSELEKLADQFGIEGLDDLPEDFNPEDLGDLTPEDIAKIADQ